MMCHLFGSTNTTKFKEDWTPLIEVASDGYILDWANILSDNLIRCIIIYRENRNLSSSTITLFYMSSFILDAVCFSFEFPSLGWKWTREVKTPIFVQLEFLWESRYHSHMFKICNDVMLPVFQFIFERKISRVTHEGNRNLRSIGRWFGEEFFTYIQIFRSHAFPYVLPLYIPDKLLAKEISY